MVELALIRVIRDQFAMHRRDTQELRDKFDEFGASLRSSNGIIPRDPASLQIETNPSSAEIDNGQVEEENTIITSVTNNHPSDNTEVISEATHGDIEVEDIFEDALEHVDTDLSDSVSTLVYSDEGSSDSTDSLKLQESFIAPSASESSQITRRRGAIPVGLGFLHWSTTNYVERRPNGDVRRSSYHTTYRFLPSISIYSGGLQLLCRWNSIYGGISIPWGTLRPMTRVPDDAPIIKAVQRGHLVRVIELISSGQASAHDVDTSGRGLLEHAIYPKVVTLDRLLITELAFILVRYLIKCGAEPAKAMPAIYEQQCQLRQQELIPFAAEVTDLYQKPYSKPSNIAAIKKARRVLEDIARLCLDKAVEDPYQDPELRLKMWKSSEVGPWNAPIDSFYLYHENWPIGIEDLALELPEEVFSMLLSVDVYSPNDNHDLISRLDRRYSVLAALYNAGIPSKAFARDAVKRTQLPPRSLATGGFCRGVNSHLVHLLIARSNLLRCETRYRDTIRQHLLRMLVLLLRNGEDPHRRCPCAVIWNGNEGELRTPTDLAIGRNLLDIWNEALKQAGCDPQDFVEDRVVSLPVEACLGVWNDLKSTTSGGKIKVSPDVQRNFLRVMASFSNSRLDNFALL